jgi:riboflavin synthase
MFTGIVEERGQVVSREDRGPGARLRVRCRTVASDVNIGDSISVSGVCLTVVDRSADSLAFDLVPETVARSTLGGLSPGDPVNLERPVTLSTRLGGHLVQGHVDAVGAVRAVEANGGGARMRIACPSGLRRYVVEKGSVAVDGVSLTVARTGEGGFEVALVPHTIEATTLGARRPGDEVNLETDVLAKYVEGLTGGTP